MTKAPGRTQGPALQGRTPPERELPEVTLTALLARESEPPPGEEPVEWLLLSNLPVETPEQAIETLSWYLCKWQIEIDFKVLKSGCRVEALQLETRKRLEPALALYMIIARAASSTSPSSGATAPKCPAMRSSPRRNGAPSIW